MRIISKTLQFLGCSDTICTLEAILGAIWWVDFGCILLLLTTPSDIHRKSDDVAGSSNSKFEGDRCSHAGYLAFAASMTFFNSLASSANSAFLAAPTPIRRSWKINLLRFSVLPHNLKSEAALLPYQFSPAKQVVYGRE
jgi:hypothetical protein